MVMCREPFNVAPSVVAAPSRHWERWLALQRGHRGSVVRRERTLVPGGVPVAALGMRAGCDFEAASLRCVSGSHAGDPSTGSVYHQYACMLGPLRGHGTAKGTSLGEHGAGVMNGECASHHLCHHGGCTNDCPRPQPAIGLQKTKGG